MCDPLSITASVLTVVACAAQSCDGLCRFLRSISEVSEDIQHHIAALQALQSTFAGIAALERDIPIRAFIKPAFKVRLNECMLDLQEMEKLVKSFHIQLEEGRVRRMWTRVRWSSLSHNHKLQKYLSRIESYHTTFSLDLLLLNM